MSAVQTLLPVIPLSLRHQVLARASVVAASAICWLRPRYIRSLLSVLRWGAKGASYAGALDARNAVIAVSLICAGEGCLQRSIAASLYCRLRGTLPTWCLGVQVEPFKAHAWIEAEGRAVDEVEDVRTYSILMRLSPRGV